MKPIKPRCPHCQAAFIPYETCFPGKRTRVLQIYKVCPQCDLPEVIKAENKAWNKFKRFWHLTDKQVSIVRYG